MQKISQEWLLIAQHNFDVCQYLFRGAKYPHAIYYGCQALEKVLKAYIIEVFDVDPPRTHRFQILAKMSKLPQFLSEAKPLRELSEIYGRVRYPDIAQVKYNTKQKATPLITKLVDYYQCVYNELKNL